MSDTNLKNILRLALCLSLYYSLCPVWAEDWPTYQHDNRRSGVTGESLTLPLQPRWEVSTDLPQTAWAGPAKWDSFANTVNLKSMRNFDPVFYTTVVGDRMFYGSSVDDAVHCLDVTTGKEQWAFFTEGPVRLPPAYHDGHLLFTSDDGYAYCVDAASATELWKVRCAGSDRKVPNNGKLISLWPSRTGVLVADGIAYFSASLFPWKTSYLCGADVKTGSLKGPGLFKREHTQMTLQGPMLASSKHLYVSQGRQTPLVFQRQDGQLVRSLGSSGFGGVHGLLTDDATFVHGQGQNHRALGSLRFFKDAKKGPLFTYPRATSMVIHKNAIYLYADGQLQALQRDTYIQLQSEKTQLEKKISTLKDRLKKLKPEQAGIQGPDLKQQIQDATAALAGINQQVPSAYRWKVKCDCPLSLILAGDTLYAGGKNQVVACDAKTGEQQWQASVSGQAYGLTVSNGCLIVSTDLGKIICFGQGDIQARENVTAVDSILARLRKTARAMTAFQSKIAYSAVQPELTESLRKGDFFFQRNKMGSHMRINFQTLQEDDQAERTSPYHYLFDGIWFTTLDYESKYIQKRQLTEQYNPIDAFDLAQGHLPILGFSATEDLRKDFDIELVDADGTEDKDLCRLKLKPKPDSTYANEYTSLKFTIDTKQWLPKRIDTVTTEGDIYWIEFSQSRLNKAIDDKVFELNIPRGFGKPDIIPLES